MTTPSVVYEFVRRIWPFRPEPYLITPRSEEEARYGKPVLVAPGDISVILDALNQHCPDCEDLIDKFQELEL